MKAAMPPLRWALATTCRASVVLPLDSGPKISTTRPQGMPWPPRAMSSERLPVGMPRIGVVVPTPSGMMAPSPNSFSIWASVFFRVGLVSSIEEAPSLRARSCRRGSFLGHRWFHSFWYRVNLALRELMNSISTIAIGGKRSSDPRTLTSDLRPLISDLYPLPPAATVDLTDQAGMWRGGRQTGDCPNFRGHRPGTDAKRWSALVGGGRRKWDCPLKRRPAGQIGRFCRLFRQSHTRPQSYVTPESSKLS